MKLRVCTPHGVCKLGDHMGIRVNFLWERFLLGGFHFGFPRGHTNMRRVSVYDEWGPCKRGPHVGGTCVCGVV